MGMGLHVRGKGAEEVSNPAQRRRCRPWSGPISDLFLGVRVARVTNNSKTVVFPTGERLFAKFHTVLRRHTSLQSQIEPEGILPTEQGRRPADVLFVPTPLCRQSQWALYPYIALDFAVVSPFTVGEFQVATEKTRGLQVLMPKPNVLIMLLKNGVEPKELDLKLWFLRCWAA